MSAGTLPVSLRATAPVHVLSRSCGPATGWAVDPVACSRWNPPWAHQHVAWPDFGVPADEATLRTALEDLLSRARRPTGPGYSKRAVETSDQAEFVSPFAAGSR
jgi:hypothetical protein